MMGGVKFLILMIIEEGERNQVIKEIDRKIERTNSKISKLNKKQKRNLEKTMGERKMEKSID